MEPRHWIADAAVFALSLSLVACGGSPAVSRTSATVGLAGGTLQTASAALTIPAGAVSAGTVDVTMTEAEPHHAGRAARVEIEIENGQLGTSAELAVKLDDANAKPKMLYDDGVSEHLVDVEVEDRNHHMYKTGVTGSAAIEVEMEHGVACAPACATGEECDDGVCKADLEDEHAAACGEVCGSGLECENGACQPHGTGRTGAATCDAGCASGLACTNGICKVPAGV